MERPAPADYEIHKLIRNRWSPRAFSDEPVSEDELLRLLEAARWAPSCFNEQPWRFIVGRRGDETYEKILDCLVEFNRNWAAGAPVLMLTVAKRDFTHNGEPNRHGEHDVGLAMGNMLAQATSMGLFVHQMGGFDADLAREKFRIPDNFEPVAAAALGYHGDPDELDDELKERELEPRERKPLKEMVFTGEWDETAEFI